MEYDEVEYKELEQDVEDEADPTKYFRVVFSLNQFKGKKH